MESARILVVEDEAIIAMDIQNMLKKCGFNECDVSYSGEESVIKALAKNPDLVLMDVKLKGNLDGVSAAEQIQARLNIPVVYITGYGEETILKKAKKTNSFNYINKPFEEKELLTTIKKVLIKSERRAYN